MSDKNTKAYQAVTYDINSRINNADDRFNQASYTAKIEKTHSSTTGLPKGKTNIGVLLTAQSETARNYGYQLFINKDGEFATRYKQEGDPHYNGTWKTYPSTEYIKSEVSSVKNEMNNIKQDLQTKNFDHYFKLPEEESEVSDIDLISKSSIRKVPNTTSNGNFPSSVPNGSRAGIIQTFMPERNGTGVVFQLYITKGSGNKGVIHTRTRINFRWQPWTTIDPSVLGSGGNVNLSDYFKKFERDISESEIDKIKVTGIYKLGGGAGSPLPSSQSILIVMGKDTGHTTQMIIGCSGSNGGKMKIRGIYGSTWTPWSDLTLTGITQQQGDNRYVRKSGTDTGLKFSDLNNVNGESGFYSTSPNCKNTPLGQHNGYGVLELIYENSANKAGIQRWSSIEGDGIGRVWERVHNGTSYQPWKEITSNLSNYLTKPTPANGNINTLDTGFYITSDQTTGLPQVKALGGQLTDVHKKGLLKVTVSGNTKLYEYTPFGGDHKGKTFTTVTNPTARNLDWVNWDILSFGAGHLRVVDARGNSNAKPQDYISHDNYNSGYVTYMEAFTNQIQLTQDPDKRATVQTIVPWNKGSYDNATDDSVRDITQIAYVNDSRIFIRHGAQDAQHWGQWKEIGLQDKGFRSPETDSISDADNVLYSGVYKTTESNPSTQHLPSVDNRNGFLTHYKYDANGGSNGTAVQYWQTYTGNGKGKIWTRYKADSVTAWQPWTEIGSGGGGSNIDFNTWYN